MNSVLQKADIERQRISRGIADIVDATDRAFGDPRVEDLEEIVQVKVDLKPSYWKEDEFGFNVPVRARIPLPVLKRRANIFLQFDSLADANDRLSDAVDTLDENKSFAAGIISKLSDQVDAGTKLDLYWRSGVQTGIRPFIRYQIAPDPWRYYVEQQVYYHTDDHLGGRTSFQVDRLLTRSSFIRFAASADYKETMDGVNYHDAFIYRMPGPWATLFSAEIGAGFNPYSGDPNGSSRSREDDGDKLYSRLRLIGKPNLDWIELEVEPGVDYCWHHDQPWDYGITFTVRIIFESYLKRR